MKISDCERGGSAQWKRICGETVSEAIKGNMKPKPHIEEHV